MSKSGNKLAALTSMFLIGAMQPQNNPYKENFDDFMDDMNGISRPVKREPAKPHQNMSEREKAIKNGLTEFHYSSNSLFALNQTNADTKARKLGYID